VANSIFAQNLRFLRKTYGLSQQKLAAQVGLKRNNIASYEAGIVEPRSVNFLKLADFFEMPPAELMQKDLADTMMGSEALDSSGMQAEQLSKALQGFVHGTGELQVIVEGFREFYRMREGNQRPVPHVDDFKNLLDIMEQLLTTNWLLLQQITDHSSH
jgi:transcriptional regulator with XRE-family HTH domain